MTTPTFLKPGDTVGILSTARKISEEELGPFLALLKSWGLGYKLGRTIGAAQHQFAGDDSLRIADFQEMLDNSEIKAIWCARGGYGTVRIIDALDFTHFILRPKWVIGYSDVTALHSHIHKFGVETLHANMAMEMEKKSDATRTSIREVLFGADYQIIYTPESSLNRTGICSGQLVGGNLSLLYSLCGSTTAISTTGKILFIEDLDEYLYHIDRMLQNLKRNGMFDNVAGLIVGGMSDMKDNDIPFGKTAEEIVLDTVVEYKFPVCFQFPAGHIMDNRALILGREVKLDISPQSVQLKFERWRTTMSLVP